MELEEDDDRYIYEVEVLNGETEYEFEIDAYSGEIIKMEIDD
ncbi:MAG: PepSY domain-containing protein [Clostridia bacterium]